MRESKILGNLANSQVCSLRLNGKQAFSSLITVTAILSRLKKIAWEIRRTQSDIRKVTERAKIQFEILHFSQYRDP